MKEILEVNQRPNLFNYATSELSQDAFICWLVSWADEKYENNDLHKVAKEFICLMYNLDREKSKYIESNQVKLFHKPFQNPSKQFEKIDVLFISEIQNDYVIFIIEDKTNTGQHDNQLARYKRAIFKEKAIKVDNLVCIYFKTGYLFDEESIVKKFGYKVLDIKKVIDFLNQYNVLHNSIYQDYKDHINKIYFERETDINDYKLPERGQALLKKDYVQWDFMKQLSDKCVERDGHRALYRGKNPDGKPWTHYRFIRFENLYGIDSYEDLFYRIDGRLNKETTRWEIYLSIRQYSAIKKFDSEIKKKKVDRLKKYIELFKEYKQEEIHNLKFSNISNDNSGANESEIAILFFDNSKVNTVNKVLEEMSKIHKLFVESIMNDKELNYLPIL